MPYRASLLIFVMWFIFQTVRILPNSGFKIDFVDVGQGDSSVLGNPVQGLLLVDGGAGNQISRFLNLHDGIFTCGVKYIFISHFDTDHAQGIANILPRCSRKTTFNDIHVYASDLTKLKDLVNLNIYTDNTKISLEKISKGDIITIFGYPPEGQIQIHVLWPPEVIDQSLSSENDLSLVLLLDAGTYEVLYTGDVSGEVLSKLDLNKFKGIIDTPLEIYKVPHHGSKNSVNTPFVVALKPSICVISVGKNNYGHPHPDMLESLRSSGCKILRTDEMGDIEFRL